MGHGIKVYIKVEGDIGNVSTVAPGQPLNFTMTYKQGKDYTVLVAFGSNPVTLDTQAIQQVLNAHLPGVKVLDSSSYDWNNATYSKGTWVGQLSPGLDREILCPVPEDPGADIFRLR